MDRLAGVRSPEELDRLREDVMALPDSWEQEDFGEVLAMLREEFVARGGGESMMDR